MDRNELITQADFSIDKIYSYLPHGKSLRVIEAIESFNSKNLTAISRFGLIPSSINQDGTCSIYSGIENIAQAAAILQVINRFSNSTSLSKDKLGYIISIKNLECLDDVYLFQKINEEIKVVVSSSEKIGSVYQVNGFILNKNSEQILSAKLTLYEA